MPTSTGLPKVGERIRLRVLDGPAVEGVVLQRSGGQLWGIKVRFDGGRVDWITVAGWHMKRGELEVIR